MAAIRRSSSASAVWLLKKVEEMAVALGRRGGGALTDRKIIDGYLLIAKKTQGVSGKPGLAPHMQSARVKNSVRLTALAMDLPAFLCLPGRYIIDGEFDPDKAYVQSLPAGRDSYVPKTLDSVLEAMTNPLTLAGAYKDIALGARNVTGNRVSTRFWGVAQPFEDVGCMYGYGAVYLSKNSSRWALSWARANDTFVYRLVVQAPTYLQYVTTDGTEAVVPATPTALPTTWTLDISESVLSGLGAVAFTRRVGLPVADYEANWEQAQYPWFTFGAPGTYLSDDGTPGYKLVVAAQVVYDYGGPYFTDDSNSTYGWGEADLYSPAGGRGLWVGEIQVIKGAATVLNQYRIYGGDSGDETRQPRFTDVVDDPERGSFRSYHDNVSYKTSPVTIGADEARMVSLSFVDRTAHPVGETMQPPELWLFLDVYWFQGGVQRSQNILTTRLSRSVFVPTDNGGEIEGWYQGHLTAFSAGLSEGRFLLGSATDGVVMVAPVFSSFRPGESPHLQVIVVSKTSATIGYSGTPGFAMSLGSTLDEMVDIQYVEHPVTIPDPGEGLGTTAQFWSLPAGDGQVTYIGNGKFMFYASTEWTTPSSTDYSFTPSANLAIAVYDLTLGTVGIAGVIDAALTSSNLPNGTSTPLGSNLTQVYWGGRPGRIEVVRPESTGYKSGADGQPQDGHPATLIVTAGRGAPAVSLGEEAGLDIKEGSTAISYDSGKTWTKILSYGSPAGAFHCGNTAQARSEPVVRI
jgi:hypothetical protein